MEQSRMNQITNRYLPAVFLTCVAATTLVYRLTTPLPESYSAVGVLAFDASIVLLAWPFFYHCRRTLGVAQGLLFFFMAAMFMGSQESFWIALGKLGLFGQSYSFTTGFFWFFFTPLNVCVGWFIVCYASYFLARWALPRSSSFKVAALSGLVALSVDLWLDPAAVNVGRAANVANLWNWDRTPEPTLFGIPFHNFWGWFLAVSIFTFVFDSCWRRAPAEGQGRLRDYFRRLGLGWVLVFVGLKPLEKLLEAAAPYRELLPLAFEPGQPTPLMWLGMAVIPALILACIVAYLVRARKDAGVRKDKWFLVGYVPYYLINLGIAYAVQIAFPGTALIFIVLAAGWVPWGLMLYSLTRNRIVSPARYAPNVRR